MASTTYAWQISGITGKHPAISGKNPQISGKKLGVGGKAGETPSFAGPSAVAWPMADRMEGRPSFAGAMEGRPALPGPCPRIGVHSWLLDVLITSQALSHVLDGTSKVPFAPFAPLQYFFKRSNMGATSPRSTWNVKDSIDSIDSITEF